jgi:hypothetical protein
MIGRPRIHPLNLPWEEAISKVLQSADGPMSVPEITEQIVKRKLRRSFGATSRNSVNNTIFLCLKRNPPPFERTARGLYQIRSDDAESLVNDADAVEEDEVEEAVEKEQAKSTGVIKAIGMYWERSKVNWNTVSPKLLGKETADEDATVIDFSGERGLYLLYDRHEPVYVGETTGPNQNLGKRLKQHVNGRLSGRWDRFSWFGVYKPKDNGTLDDSSKPVNLDTVIISMEAVLIELLGTRQNRQRGWYLEDCEYVQADDPNIGPRKRAQDAILDLATKLGVDLRLL